MEAVDVEIDPAPLWTRLTGGRREPSEPPLIRGRVPFLGCAVPFGKDAPAFLRRCRAEHGDVFTVLIGGERMTFVLDPHAVPGLLRERKRLSFAALAHDLSARAFGHPRLHDPLASDLMRITGDSLKREELPLLSARAQQVLDRWLGAQGGPGWIEAELYDFVQRAMFVVGCESIFGGDWTDARLLDDFLRFDERFPMLAGGLPAALFPRAYAARRRLAAQVQPGGADASAFIHARRQRMHGMSLPDIGHVELSILWATLANTLPAAYWTVAHLLADRAALDRVQQEVDELDRSHGTATTEALASLSLTQSAISEALRLSSASITIRRVLRDCELPLPDDRSFAARSGDLVCIFPYLTHHDGEVFDEPERFVVDRFVRNGRPRTFTKGGKRLAVALMPYGGGVSMCPGRHLANTEILQFVSGLLTRLELEPVDRVLPPLEYGRAGLGVLPPQGTFRFRYRLRASDPK